MKNKNLYGLVVCGGASSRMGEDKGMINYHGTAQRYYLYKLMQDLCEKVFISINPQQIHAAEAGFEYLVDKKEYYGIGPMAALLSAFDQYPENDWLLIGCDYPYIDKAAISSLINAADNKKTTAFYNEETGFYEPLLAVYSTGIKSKLFHQFTEGNHSLQFLLKESEAGKLIAKDQQLIRNINTKEEMNEAKNVLQGNKVCKTFSIKKIKNSEEVITDDLLTAEEPLEISVSFKGNNGPEKKIVSVTMRSPGDDEALAAGFLFTEGIIKSKSAIKEIKETDENKLTVFFNEGEKPSLQNAERNFYTTSGCGVCGKASIDAIKTVSVFGNDADGLSVTREFLFLLPEKLRLQQDAFNNTGGIHASAFFDLSGEIKLIAEDAGRHNALDKLIGHAMMKDLLPLNNGILLLSGRVSFELVQKAMMAGIRFIAAIGAPSSLAVEAAEEAGITVAGFLRNGSFNLYSHLQRLKVQS